MRVRVRVRVGGGQTESDAETEEDVCGQESVDKRYKKWVERKSMR